MATQWTDAASYAAYQADNTSAESMSDDAVAAAEGGGACRFIHNQCEKELFTSEYLRSNKASGHKNLRCFPHCCGGHNPKSFCGSGLVVECFLSNCQLVLGRFEEVAKQQPVNSKTLPSPTPSTSVDTSLGRCSLVVGREYPRQELFDDVKMPDQPFGRWFRGSAVPHGSSNSNNNNSNSSTCFLLNGNRQSWHYGWQSSRLNCKNLHVFKVYVFDASASGNANTLTCVVALASPAFRISSSRKARKTFRSPMNQAAMANGAAAMGIPVARGPGVVSPPPQSARSIDELLGNATGNNSAAANAAALFAAAQQQQQQQQRQAPTGFLAGQRDPARRERKRLTRSASLKTDYFSTISFPTIQQQQQQQQFQQQQRLSLSATHPPRFEGLQENRASTPSLPGVGSFLNNPAVPRAAGGGRPFHTRRSSLAALPMPVSNPMGISRQQQRPVPVLTPITGMMQLRLESHSPYTSTPMTSSTPSSSSSAASSSRSGPPPASTTRLTAAALHQHAYASARPYPYARRDTWSSSLQGMIVEGGGIPMMMMSPGSSPDSYLNRKRNRSTDSDKAITAAIEASEKIHPTLSPVSSPGYTPAMVAPVPTDSELYRRARILQLAFTIVKRIHRFEEVAAKQKEPTPKVYRHSFEMITPPMPTTPPAAASNQTPRAQRKKCTLVQIPLSNPKLLYLCSNLVTVCTALVSSGLLEDMRQKMHDCAQAGRGALAAYAQLVDLLNDAAEAQVSRLPRRMHKSWGDAESADEGEWDLYEMLKSCEPWLLQEPWWVVLDDDDQQQTGDKEEGALRPLPYMNVFADYYRAIQDAVPSPQDLEVAVSLRKAALTGATGLTGEWNRQGEADEHHLQQPQRVASVRSATAASSLSWLARCIHAHTTKTLHVTETDTTMTLTLPNSLVSADAVFLLQLDQQEPSVVLPQDYFPFGWSRKRSLMAYRAWRVRGIGDSNGSAVAVQFMRWPDDNEIEAIENDEEEEELDDDEVEDSPEEPEEEPLGRRGRQAKRLRTRITIYFSVFSTSTLQLRTIVEASLAPVVALPTGQPSEADMLRYFKSPSSWEMRSQISQQYTKNL
ncbi:hypothetical protein PF005_g8266 [Phytophthora fragariae]|nr:hypothetical protein PF003_g8695 [Phytophthora fragariae]KAE8941150.1 hypothetical protein PF009_g9054 [Phytophthora fragariae]KAE9107896.1 hypothetical protein PF010_g12109 [Phytophthora fragariae]KAE9118944.1 hypothetical protein PF007_g8738 [Phytophthora fragariae]KAE9218452.1 hypothetical protein PF005_g8266 [Phytophthora fragariae]